MHPGLRAVVCGDRFARVIVAVALLSACAVAYETEDAPPRTEARAQPTAATSIVAPEMGDP